MSKKINSAFIQKFEVLPITQSSSYSKISIKYISAESNEKFEMFRMMKGTDWRLIIMTLG